MSTQSHPQPAPVHFVVVDAFAGGGVARTTATLANHLSRTRPVHVISLYRRRATARFPLDPAVRVTVLRDLTQPRPLAHRVLNQVPSRLRPRPSETTMSLLTDLLLRRALRAIHTGVIVSTRPSLHLAVVTFAREGVVTVGWDHLNFPARLANPVHRDVLLTAVPRLDAFVVLTAADAADYRALLPDAATTIQVMPNAGSWPVSEQQPALDSKVVVAAGRLVPRKGFLRLVRAFAPVARSYPDWQLHIYGLGPERQRIAALVEKLHLQDQVRLAGYSDDLPAVLHGASVFAMTSLSEGFPLVLVEALSAGVPVVAFDCPRGPAEIVRHGENGLLVEEGPHRRFTEALLTVVEDDVLRTRLGTTALRDAERYTVEAVSARWERLFADLEQRHASRPAGTVSSSTASATSGPPPRTVARKPPAAPAR